MGVTFDIVDETSHVQLVILYPTLALLEFVVFLLEKQDPVGAPNDQSTVIKHKHLTKIHFLRNFVTENVRYILGIYCNCLTLSVENVELMDFWIIKAAIREILTLAVLHFKFYRPFFNFSFLEIIDEMVLDMGFIVEQHHE